MALIYETLHPRVASFLVRHFGLRQPVRTQVAPDIQPVVEINHLFRHRPDMAFEQGWRSFVAHIFVAAGAAGNQSAVGLAIPSGRAAIAFGYILGVQKTAPELAQYGVLTTTALVTTLANVSPNSQVDSRQDVTGFTPAVQQATFNTGVIPTTPAILPAAPFAVSTPRLWFPFVLNAGHQVLVIDPTAAEALTADFVWWERDAFPVTE